MTWCAKLARNISPPYLPLRTRCQGVAYWDDTEENLGGRGSRKSSVDVEAGLDGTLHVGYGIPGAPLGYCSPFGNHFRDPEMVLLDLLGYCDCS